MGRGRGGRGGRWGFPLVASEAAGRARGRDWSLKMCVVKAWGLFLTTSWGGGGQRGR